jgi:menaquinol-cytochrome c reductase iron-sulfur subunit
VNDKIARRRFLNNVSLGLSGLAGLVLGVPVVAYLLSPLLRPESKEWIDVGPVDSFAQGQTLLRAVNDPSPVPWAGQTAQTAAWVRRTGDQEFTVFAVNCTHLGCPVDWKPDADLFLCPCHGGVYYSDGTVAGGPPPHRLFQYPVRVQAGKLQVQSPLFLQSGQA